MKKNQKEPQKIQIINIGESYASLLVGMGVVIVFGFMLASFVQSKNILKNFMPFKSQEISSSKTNDIKELKQQIIYNVVEGDDLGIISAKFYKTGDFWKEIADANKITNPDLLETGTKLIIPEIKNPSIEKELASNPLEAEKSILGASYTVQEGDDLWRIALRAYGDSYAWMKIALENNLMYPDALVTGTVLKIPR